MLRERAGRLAKAILALTCVAWSLSAHGTTDAAPDLDTADETRSAAPWKHASRLRGDWYDGVSVALVDDPHRAIIADSLGKATVWDTQRGVRLFSTPPLSGSRPTVVADGAGRRIAVGVASRDGKVTVWDTSTGARLHEAPGTSPDISRDGSVLAAITAWDTVTLWDVESGDALGSIISGKPAAKAVALDAKGARVAIGWADKRAEVWDMRTGERLMLAEGHAGAVSSVDLTPDGPRLATAAADHRAKVWEVATGALVGTYGSKYRTVPSGVVIDSTGTRVVTALRVGFADLWDVESGARIRRYGKKRRLRVGAAALSPDGARLAGVHPGVGYSVWTVDTGERVPVSECESRFRAIATQLSSDGARALAFARFRYATLHDVATGEEIRSFGDPLDEEPGTIASRVSLLGVRLLGDGRQYLDAYSGRGVAVRDVASDDVVTAFDTEPQTRLPLILSLDHSLLLTGGAEKHAHLWDVASGAHLRALSVDGGAVRSAAFDATNSIVVTNGQEGPVRVWDVDTGAIRATVAHTSTARLAVSVSPDGRYLLLSGGIQTAMRGEPLQPTAFLWDLGSVTQIAASTETIDSVAWAADSARFYAASVAKRSKRVVEVWSPRAFGRLLDMPGAEAWIRPAIHRVPDPSAGSNGGRPNVALTPSVGAGTATRAHMQGITRLAVSADGGTFAHVESDGSIDVWRREAREGDAGE